MRIRNMSVTLHCDGDKRQDGVEKYSCTADLTAKTDIAKGEIVLSYAGSWFKTWENGPLPLDRVFLTPANARILATALAEMADEVDRRCGRSVKP